MTDATASGAPATAPANSLMAPDARTARRNAAEKRFRAYGLGAIAVAFGALVVLLLSILSNGLGAFTQAKLSFPVTLQAEQVAEAEGALLKTSAYKAMLQEALAAYLAEQGTDVDAEVAISLLSDEAAATLREFALANADRYGEPVPFTILANGRIDGFFKGRVTYESAELDRNVSPEQLRAAESLRDAGVLTAGFNWSFITAPDASDNRVEAAGLGVAMLGSLYMMLVVLVLALPIGVAASIYLEEFAPQNRLTDLIEVNISNLAAVPSIVFGILGLAIFINWAGLPQSAPIVGGLVLTLMTLPTIIIATRAALKAVPPSIRDAALGLGASKMQSVFHHVLPLAMPGILTGTIIGLAQALGETAPLLLIGMVAFVREYPDAPPEGLFDPASALPVQIYNWTQRADPGFFERASGAIIVLLLFLLVMNLTAIFLRRRFERRW
ncbi:phosphate ABC transporter permease PstA [Jannaschia sp. Os4]|uniref:phosphate ABC transporter permease PstA n=1 Tax=Jannaschia sp. Os4 TaxID=2807617 RepID=UPI001939FA03|nr:phosphate ABC transporter permease PstA [Jannaschia sp. Os4]MBM2576522.1 phosphate ABC transporter permease PstA [Jannaschia sp. Os4]